MKTLEETINGLQICFDSSKDCIECPYEKQHNIDSVIPLCIDMLTQDAIYYLKFFKDYSIRQKELSDKLLQKMQQVELVQNLIEVSNEPLSWDELKGMVGNPVWIEDYDYEDDTYKRWFIVEKFEKAEEDEYVLLNSLYFSRNYYGNKDDGWQAYRKERK